MNKTVTTMLLIMALASLAVALLLMSFVLMPGESMNGDLPELTAVQRQAAENMRQTVRLLADDIGERHYEVPEAYLRAADYISDAFVEVGLTPYTELFGDNSEYRNIIAEHYGVELPEEIILVGAHYDTVWMSPGADDNASGVAVMLEMARQIKTLSLKRSIRFVGFANEEYPHYLSGDMGSLFHARQASERREMITAMFSLEMLGFYSDKPDSQNYPKPFSWVYPDTANFVAFVSNFKSRGLLTDSLRIFREARQFPSEGLAAPTMLVPDVRRSDQASFWRYAYPAVMVTDTGAYRNFGYHNVSDVPKSLDYEHMARIVTGLVAVIKRLANQ